MPAGLPCHREARDEDKALRFEAMKTGKRDVVRIRNEGHVVAERLEFG